MSWAPQPQGLEELVACLRNSGSPDTKVQESINEVRLLCFVQYLSRPSGAARPAS